MGCRENILEDRLVSRVDIVHVGEQITSLSRQSTDINLPRCRVPRLTAARNTAAPRGIKLMFYLQLSFALVRDFPRYTS